jgi:hypothetical protein
VRSFLVKKRKARNGIFRAVTRLSSGKPTLQYNSAIVRSFLPMNLRISAAIGSFISGFGLLVIHSLWRSSRHLPFLPPSSSSHDRVLPICQTIPSLRTVCWAAWVWSHSGSDVQRRCTQNSVSVLLIGLGVVKIAGWAVGVRDSHCKLLLGTGWRMWLYSVRWRILFVYHNNLEKTSCVAQEC